MKTHVLPPFLASAFFLLYSINKAKEYECCKMSSVSTSNVKEIKEIEFMTFSNKTQKVSWLLIVFVIILFFPIYLVPDIAFISK